MTEQEQKLENARRLSHALFTAIGPGAKGSSSVLFALSAFLCDSDKRYSDKGLLEQDIYDLESVLEPDNILGNNELNEGLSSALYRVAEKMDKESLLTVYKALSYTNRFSLIREIVALKVFYDIDPMIYMFIFLNDASNLINKLYDVIGEKSTILSEAIGYDEDDLYEDVLLWKHVFDEMSKMKKEMTPPPKNKRSKKHILNKEVKPDDKR